jgi:hypothetical protein
MIPTGPRSRSSRVYLPFALDSRKIDMILTCLLFGDCSGKMY